MRTLFLILCLANIAVAMGMIWWMPDPMATRFGDGGQPVSVMSPDVFAVFIGGLVVLFVLLVLGMPRWMRMLPASLFNLPNRSFWMNEENRPRTERRIRSFLNAIGVAMMLLFLLLQWLTFQANRTTPPQLNLPIFWCSFAGFLAAIATLTVQFYLSFRLPKTTDSEIQ